MAVQDFDAKLLLATLSANYEMGRKQGLLESPDLLQRAIQEVALEAEEGEEVSPGFFLKLEERFYRLVLEAAAAAPEPLPDVPAESDRGLEEVKP